MSKLGIGLYSLAGVYGPKDRAEIERMLVQAVEWGVTFFDVADQYGPAEEVLGTVLALYRSQIQISTKVGVTDDGGRDCSRQHIYDACKKSLQRLNVEYLDYYQIHFDDPQTPVEETVAALEGLRKEGLIREYNIGHLPADKVKEYVEKGQPVAVMMEVSPVAWKQYRELLPFCRQRGLKILAMGTSGRGLLTGKIRSVENLAPGDIRRIDPLFQRSMLQSGLRVLAELQKLGRVYGKTPVQVALNWILQLPQVEVALSGPSTVAHLKENLGALGWTIAEEHRCELERLVEVEEGVQRKSQFADLQTILAAELALDSAQVLTDLIYVISGLIELNLVEEKELVPLFQDVMRWQKLKGSRAEVEAIHRKLRLYLK